MKRYLCLLLCRLIALPALADNPEEEQLPVLNMTNRKQIAGKEIERFQAHVPNCRVAYKTSESTGATWREHWCYNIMRESLEKRKYKPFVR